MACGQKEGDELGTVDADGTSVIMLRKTQGYLHPIQDEDCEFFSAVVVRPEYLYSFENISPILSFTDLKL